jgi:hypothetical protein
VLRRRGQLAFLSVLINQNGENMDCVMIFVYIIFVEVREFGMNPTI